MSKMSRTALASMFLCVLGLTVVAVAAWQAFYIMPNQSEGPGTPGSPPGGPGQPATVELYLNNALWTNNTKVDWGAFKASENKSVSFGVKNNGLQPLTAYFSVAGLGTGWSYGYTKNMSVVAANSRVDGTLWLNCSYSAFGWNNFTSTIHTVG